MADVGDLWSGEDWQTYCNELLSLRYDLEYQPVPDTDKGDWGIEGFTKGGALFQCYATQNPRSLDELYEKQRDKMTVDLGKMERNLEPISAVVTPAEIAYWTLLVPRCETKRLLQHAQRKADEIRAKIAGDQSGLCHQGVDRSGI